MSRRKKIHVFICINPIVNIYIDGILEKIDCINEKVLIIEFYPTQIMSKKSSRNNCSFLRYNYSNKWEYFLFLIRYKSKVDSIIKKYQKKIFYFSHPLHLTTNFIFFSKIHNLSLNLIPDGIASYYNAQTDRFYKKMILKKIIGLFTGIPYTIYYNHITNYEQKSYKKIYYLNKNKIVTSGKDMEKIELPELPEVIKDTRKVIILGTTFIDENSFRNYIENILRIIAINEPEGIEVYYKNHPSDFQSIKLKKYLKDRKVQTLITNSQAELMAHKYKSIYSTISSALYNVKLFYGTKINCYLCLSRGTNSSNMIHLKKVFKDQGVQLIDID